MSSLLNHKVFYDNIRPLFSGGLKNAQVYGMEVILYSWENKYQQRTPITQFSDVLATTFHETNQTMQPIHEIGNHAYFTKLYDVTGSRPSLARKMGNVHPGDGAKFCGRGDVQLTWYANYLKADQKLRAMGLLKVGESLITNPDLAMRTDLASVILFEGMEDGWFTGLKLDDEIDAVVDGDEFADFVKARKIINGSDRAQLIAGYATHFLTALQEATK